MFCKQCGNQLLDNARFCNKCGCPVSELVLPASTLKRISNYLIDYVVAFLLVFIFSFFAESSSGATSAIMSTLGIVLFFGYYLICESIWQRTMGKVITKTKVVDREGNKPSFLKILGRSFARYIPFEPLSFLFGGYPIGWHDSLSKTLVVSSDLSPEKVREMDFEQIKKQKSHSTVAVILIVLVAGMVMISIIGILASVVLASLNTARMKGADASVKANLSSLRAEAELYYNFNNNSYSGLCDDSRTLGLLKSASVAGNTNQNESNYVCNDSQKNYASSVPLRSGGYWCVDDSGRQVQIDASIGARTSCI